MGDNAIEDLINTLECVHGIPYRILRAKYISRHGYAAFRKAQHRIFSVILSARWARQSSISEATPKKW